MRRVICCVHVCITFALMVSYDAAAQSKKKSKEAELAISKRGKLIFEDDFSGRDLEWVFPPERGEWKILKKTLVTTAVNRSGLSVKDPIISHAFAGTENVIFELRVLLPVGDSLVLAAGNNVQSPDVPNLLISNDSHLISIGYWDKTGRVDLGFAPFAYPKSKWISLAYEMINGLFAATVDGKTAQAQTPDPKPVRKSAITVNPLKRHSPEVLAVDDVKVWEALPKDEEPEKDKKKK